ncbi:hypothetical protein BASA83_009161 [Batrachochytrium salamandrivorans]|nr:hypothetical protein BASA83_009161 [Batrachochytrium salamandrivorans]
METAGLPSETYGLRPDIALDATPTGLANNDSPRLDLHLKIPLQLSRSIHEQIGDGFSDWGSDDNNDKDADVKDSGVHVPAAFLDNDDPGDDAFWDEPDKSPNTSTPNVADNERGDLLSAGIDISVENRLFELQETNCNWDELERDLMEFSLGDQQDRDWADAMTAAPPLVSSLSNISMDPVIEAGQGTESVAGLFTSGIEATGHLPYRQSQSSTLSGMHSPALLATNARRYLQSPVPSSNASAVASESDDEGFDDIGFTSQTHSLVLNSMSSANRPNSISFLGSSFDDTPQSFPEKVPTPLSRLKQYTENSLSISCEDDSLFQDSDLDFDLPSNDPCDSFANRLKSRLDSTIMSRGMDNALPKGQFSANSLTGMDTNLQIQPNQQQPKKDRLQRPSDGQRSHQTVPVSPLSMASIDSSYSQFGKVTRVQNYSQHVKTQGRSVSTSIPSQSRHAETAAASRLQASSSLAMRRPYPSAPAQSKPLRKIATGPNQSTAKSTVTSKSTSISSTRPVSDRSTSVLRSVGGPAHWDMRGTGTELDHIEDLPVDGSTSTTSGSIRNRAHKPTPMSTSGISGRPVWSRTGQNSSPKNSTMQSIPPYKCSPPPPRPPPTRIAFGRTMGYCDERDLSRSSSGILGMGGMPSYRTNSKQGSKQPPKKKREIKKPTLIKSVPSSDTMKVGDMALVTPQRPALIQNIASAGLKLESVGGMVFDPNKMCWIGNDEDADVFADIDMGNMFTVESEPTASTAFVLSKLTREGLYISEASHKLFMGLWYPRVVQDRRMVMRDMSKAYLYEIRTILDHA